MLGRKRNDNILKPVKLSTQVIGSTGRFQEPNEVRSMLAKYKKKLMVCKKDEHLALDCFFLCLQVVNKCLIPDEQLSTLLGSREPFKSGDLFKLLKVTKHIQSS
jgi:hypothetical protein